MTKLLRPKCPQCGVIDQVPYLSVCGGVMTDNSKVRCAMANKGEHKMQCGECGNISQVIKTNEDGTVILLCLECDEKLQKANASASNSNGPGIRGRVDPLVIFRD